MFKRGPFGVNTLERFPNLGVRFIWTHTNRSALKINHVSTYIGKRTVKTPTIDWKPLKSNTTALSTAEYQAKIPILRRFFLGLMIAMPVISFFLGCWQVKRLKWKVDLISKCENSLAEPPLDILPPNIDPGVIPEFEYRRFKIKGRFDYSQEMFLGPRIKNGMTGYLVIVPFIRSNGGKPILVERGWISKDKVIPENRKHGYLSHLSLPQGEVEIEALFRQMPEKSYLQFDHEKGNKLFHIPDVKAMAEQSGALPVYCQMIYDLKDHPEWKSPEAAEKDNSSFSIRKLFKSGKDKGKAGTDDHLLSRDSEDATLQYQEFEFIEQGVPIAATPKVKLTNNHLQYLVTWFGLSFFSTVLLAYNFWKRKNFSSAEKVIKAKRDNMKKNW